MAEWSIAAVLKTVEGHTSGGSNPSLSALPPGLPGGFFYIKIPSKLIHTRLSEPCQNIFGILMHLTEGNNFLSKILD